MRQKTVITKLLQSVTEVYYKVRQVLQSVTEVYYKVRQALQSASGITKCDRLLLQSAPGITKCDRLLLQSASGITKCDSYYKVRRNMADQVCSMFIHSRYNISVSFFNDLLEQPGHVIR